MSSLSNNIGEFAGPALATSLVLGVGAGWAFALDAGTFLLSAAFLTRVRAVRAGAPSRVAPAPASARRLGVWAEIRQGFREVRSHSWVWATLASFCVALFTGLAPWFVLGPVVAREQYGHIGVYGVRLGSARPGHDRRIADRHRLAAALPDARGDARDPAVAGRGDSVCGRGARSWLVVPVMIVGGVGIALFDVWWLTALAERIPAEKLSRVTSYDWAVSLGLLPIGYALAGPIAQRARRRDHAARRGGPREHCVRARSAAARDTNARAPRRPWQPPSHASEALPPSAHQALECLCSHGLARIDFLVAKDELTPTFDTPRHSSPPPARRC